jgi:hypothetical protein
VRVLVLAEPRVGAGDPDVGHQVQFVAHVPGIAMDNRDQGLAEFLGPGEGIKHAIGHRERLAGPGQGREGVHVDAAGEVLAVAEEHRRPQARVVVEVVVRLGQAEEGVRVEPVVDLGPVDPDQDDRAEPLIMSDIPFSPEAKITVERLVRERAGVLRGHDGELLRGKMACDAGAPGR